jgi:pre-mRNA branch site protein p14
LSLGFFEIYRGNAKGTRGTAFVVYEDIYDAKNAYDHLNGFQVGGKYLVALYYQPDRGAKKEMKYDRSLITGGVM